MPKRSKNTSLQKERHKLGLPEIENKSRNVLAKEAHVHPLVLGSEEARNTCWRTDVSDEAWEAGQLERFNRIFLRAAHGDPDKWHEAL